MVLEAFSVGSKSLMVACCAQAFQLLCPSKMGLGRGMACIAAFMLVVVGIEREEDAFWTLVGLVEDRVPHSCVLQVLSFRCVLLVVFSTTP